MPLTCLHFLRERRAGPPPHLHRCLQLPATIRRDRRFGAHPDPGRNSCPVRLRWNSAATRGQRNLGRSFRCEHPRIPFLLRVLPRGCLFAGSPPSTGDHRRRGPLRHQVLSVGSGPLDLRIALPRSIPLRIGPARFLRGPALDGRRRPFRGRVRVTCFGPRSAAASEPPESPHRLTTVEAASSCRFSSRAKGLEAGSLFYFPFSTSLADTKARSG